MKRLTITCEDDDLVKIVGACLKINADFQVVSVESEAKLPRTINRRSADQPQATDVVLKALRANSSGMEIRHNLRLAMVEEGYSENTLVPTLSKLRREGLVTCAGDIVSLAEKARADA